VTGQLVQFSLRFAVCQDRLNSMRYGGGIEASVHVSPPTGYQCPMGGTHRSNATKGQWAQS